MANEKLTPERLKRFLAKEDDFIVEKSNKDKKSSNKLEKNK